jgi:GNAT superfamily N-acetyltransferase
MVFSVGTVIPEDLEEVSTVIFRAYRGENTYINAAYPNNLTKEGQWAGLQKLRKFTETSERARWEKVKDETTGKIVGLAVWLIYEHEKPTSAPYHQQLSDQKYESEDAEFAATLRKSFGELQAPFWPENDLPLISTYAIIASLSTEANDTTDLCAMTVAPEYQYQGVGTMLMQSGTQFADEIGAKVHYSSTILEYHNTDD